MTNTDTNDKEIKNTKDNNNSFDKDKSVINKIYEIAVEQIEKRPEQEKDILGIVEKNIRDAQAQKTEVDMLRMSLVLQATIKNGNEANISHAFKLWHKAVDTGLQYNLQYSPFDSLNSIITTHPELSDNIFDCYNHVLRRYAKNEDIVKQGMFSLSVFAKKVPEQSENVLNLTKDMMKYRGNGNYEAFSCLLDIVTTQPNLAAKAMEIYNNNIPVKENNNHSLFYHAERITITDGLSLDIKKEALKFARSIFLDNKNSSYANILLRYVLNGAVKKNPELSNFVYDKFNNLVPEMVNDVLPAVYLKHKLKGGEKQATTDNSILNIAKYKTNKSPRE